MAALAPFACNDSDSSDPSSDDNNNNTMNTGGGGPSTGGSTGDLLDISVTGSVRGLLDNAGAVDLAGATVRVSVASEPSSAVSTTTDSDGNYTLSIDVPDGGAIVIRASATDHSTVSSRVRVAGEASVRTDFVLRLAERLSCANGRCATPRSSVVISGLPEDVRGTARAFDPNAEADAFPGDFSDNAGNLLLSGVFATIELEDGTGAPVTELSQSVRLQMRLPTSSWAIVRDVTPANDRIDVPLFSFDDDTGEWARDGSGWLEDADGAVLSEGQLASIRAGSFTGVIYVAGDVDHFSTWNCDWPVETKTTVRGTLQTDDQGPARGATVSALGVTYSGRTGPLVVNDDGSFCLEVMRSDEDGEDIDQDGVTGEAQQVQLSASLDGRRFDLGVRTVPSSEADCRSQTGGLDIGSVALTPDRQLTSTRCTLTGTATVDGVPAPGVGVVVIDSLVSPEELAECLFDQACQFAAETNGEGEFSVTFPFVQQASLTANLVETEARESRLRQRQISLTACPSTPIELALEPVWRIVEGQISTEGNAISWTPSEPIGALIVGAGKWALQGTEGDAISPPVIFGQVPAGARQIRPQNGSSPEALATGDLIQIAGTRTDENGFLVTFFALGLAD